MVSYMVSNEICVCLQSAVHESSADMGRTLPESVPRAGEAQKFDAIGDRTTGNVEASRQKVVKSSS